MNRDSSDACLVEPSKAGSGCDPESRITHHESRITNHGSRITNPASPPPNIALFLCV